MYGSMIWTAGMLMACIAKAEGSNTARKGSTQLMMLCHLL